MALRYVKSHSAAGMTPVVVDMPYTDSGSIVDGEIVKWGATTEASLLISAGATPTEVVGIAQEGGVASTTALATGTLNFFQTAVFPTGVIDAPFDMTVANHIDVVSSTSTVVTVASGDDNLDGSWGYISDGKGEGQLFYIGAADADEYTLDTTTAFSVTPDATSQLLLMRHIGRPTGGINLNTAGTLVATAVTQTGALLALDIYLEADRVYRHPLRPRGDHMRTGLHNTNVRFSQHLYPLDNAFLGPTAF